MAFRLLIGAALIVSFACVSLYASFCLYTTPPRLRAAPARRGTKRARSSPASPAAIRNTARADMRHSNSPSSVQMAEADIRDDTSFSSMQPSLTGTLDPDRTFMRDAKGDMIEVSPEMDVNNTKRIHERMLRMLKLVDQICTENKLVYWTCGGTLIGTLRHNGFVPFDADVDIAMPSESYKRFQKLAPKLLPPDVWLQDPDSDKRFPAHKRNEAKLRDLNSDYSDYSKEHKDLQNGIQLDIFIPFHECYRKTKSTCCKPLDDPLVTPIRRHAFEDMHVNVPAESETILAAKYGKWEALPDVKDRLSHQGHVDFVAPDWVKILYPKLYSRLDSQQE